jgi:SAM-dependent methyltransferase
MASAPLKKLEMLLRGAAPRPLRQLYRLGRGGFGTPMLSRRLPDELVTGCRLCADRVAMLELLPKQGVVAELGTYRGAFARKILKICKPRALHIVDIDFSRFDRRVGEAAGVHLHQGLTREVIAGFPDATFDWVYVDAGHDYASCLGDARASAPKVKPGGYLAFNDFAHVDPQFGRYGVHRAVVDFCLEARWPLAFFALDGAGLYDLALRRPEGD